MSDLADDADVVVERFTELSIAASRTPPVAPSMYCRVCYEHLEDHRKARGICVECKEIEESRERVTARGAV